LNTLSWPVVRVAATTALVAVALAVFVLQQG
jgi:hypothetical protein